MSLKTKSRAANTASKISGISKHLQGFDVLNHNLNRDLRQITGDDLQFNLTCNECSLPLNLYGERQIGVRYLCHKHGEELGGLQ